MFSKCWNFLSKTYLSSVVEVFFIKLLAFQIIIHHADKVLGYKGCIGIILSVCPSDCLSTFLVSGTTEPLLDILMKILSKVWDLMKMLIKEYLYCWNKMLIKEYLYCWNKMLIKECLYCLNMRKEDNPT